MRRSYAVAIFVMIASLSCQAEEGKKPVEKKKLGPDYKIQGEYAGTLDFDGSKWGAQIIAMGDGEFEAVACSGGLPGEGWNGDKPMRLKGKLKDGAAVFEGDEFVLKVTGDELIAMSLDEEVGGALKKVHRKSKTLGKKPPKGAVVLFDGSSVKGWEKGKMTKDKLLAATGTSTKMKFNDHQLHVEFRTPFVPKERGQGRGNSGVYVQSRYEIQVLDSFGLEGKDNECGGIYSINKPKLNMCYPPETWQTYDIDFKAAKYDADGKKIKNARITVKHNGVVIHKDQELAHGTPGRHKEEAGPDALYLQDHGNPVVFRNIWAVVGE